MTKLSLAAPSPKSGIGRMRFLFAILLAAIFCLNVSGQITGGLRGSVSDATGGGVPKATVTLTNLETKAVRKQGANAAGEFTFELLPIGNYEVKAEAPGFSGVVAQAQVNTG